MLDNGVREGFDGSIALRLGGHEGLKQIAEDPVFPGICGRVRCRGILQSSDTGVVNIANLLDGLVGFAVFKGGLGDVIAHLLNENGEGPFVTIQLLDERFDNSRGGGADVLTQGVMDPLLVGQDLGTLFEVANDLKCLCERCLKLRDFLTGLGDLPVHLLTKRLT